MSYPNEPDFVRVSVLTGSPAAPVLLCGFDNLSINQTVNTNQRARRDCAKPGQLAQVRNVPISKQWEASGSGVWNMDQVPLINSSLGVDLPFLFEFGKRDGTDEGVIVGEYNGVGMLTSANVSIGDDGAADITIAGQQAIVWTPVTPTP